jgi:hypothetical protein
MNPPRRRDPIRWRDGDADSHALESRAAILADAAKQVQPLAPQALSRIRNEVVARRPRRQRFGVFGLGRFSVRARLAFAIGLAVVCATTAGGAKMLWRKYVAATRAATPAPIGPAVRPTVHAAPHFSTRLAPVEELPPALEPPPAEPAAQPAFVHEQPRPHAARPWPSPAVVAAPRARVEPGPSIADVPPTPPAAPAAALPAASSEAALVAEALVDLRQRNDARAALATLDRHAREFPHGVLETEAFRTRIEAVIQLGDLKTALGLLDGKLASTQALGANLTLTRAELRAAAGRFGEALPDFNQVLEGAAGPLAAGGDERALYGRAVCLARLGQDERARADLLAYQKRFPEGRFAREVQRLLAGKEPPSRP